MRSLLIFLAAALIVGIVCADDGDSEPRGLSRVGAIATGTRRNGSASIPTGTTACARVIAPTIPGGVGVGVVHQDSREAGEAVVGAVVEAGEVEDGEVAEVDMGEAGEAAEADMVGAGEVGVVDLELLEEVVAVEEEEEEVVVGVEAAGVEVVNRLFKAPQWRFCRNFMYFMV
ncbi:hypothetical protein BSKO_12568 [Bryopsis sp. KO-2023]|nr:hypothetical protein BSKO_12568 [Bryopsis sp. KO-2023]